MRCSRWGLSISGLEFEVLKRQQRRPACHWGTSLRESTNRQSTSSIHPSIRPHVQYTPAVYTAALWRMWHKKKPMFSLNFVWLIAVARSCFNSQVHCLLESQVLQPHLDSMSGNRPLLLSPHSPGNKKPTFDYSPSFYKDATALIKHSLMASHRCHLLFM